MQLLIIEDEAALAQSMAQYFAKDTVQLAQTLAEASRAVQSQTPDAIILDLLLPDGDGIAWLRQWRPLIAAKVLVLTANDSEPTMLTGLKLADDYVVKPVSLRVLAARLAKLVPPERLMLGDLQVDLAAGQVQRAGQPVILSPIEWRLTAYFAQHQGVLLTRQQLIAVIWDVQEHYVSDNTLTVTIKRLREKLELDPEHPTLIRTIRGMGYFIDGSTHSA